MGKPTASGPCKPEIVTANVKFEGRATNGIILIVLPDSKDDKLKFIVAEFVLATIHGSVRAKFPLSKKGDAAGVLYPLVFVPVFAKSWTSIWTFPK